MSRYIKITCPVCGNEGIVANQKTTLCPYCETVLYRRYQKQGSKVRRVFYDKDEAKTT